MAPSWIRKCSKPFFGRQVEVIADEILGHDTVEVRITDPEVIATSGQDIHLGLTRQYGASVAGGILALTPGELAIADVYEVADYARRRVRTRSGDQAWCYVSSLPLAAAERIALFGDSIAYGRTTADGGWASKVAAHHIAVDEERNRFFNLAWPGAFLGEVLEAATAAVPARQADTVLIAAGINDSMALPAGSSESVLQDLVGQLQQCVSILESRGCRIAVMSPNWVDTSTAGGNIADVMALRESLRSWCADTSRDYLDTWSVLENRPDLLTDGIHPSAQGHLLLAHTVDQNFALPTN